LRHISCVSHTKSFGIGKAVLLVVHDYKSREHSSSEVKTSDDPPALVRTSGEFDGNVVSTRTLLANEVRIDQDDNDCC
jgi:hypothetical protein